MTWFIANKTIVKIRLLMVHFYFSSEFRLSLFTRENDSASNHHVIWLDGNGERPLVQDSSMWATGIGLQTTYKTCPPYMIHG